MSGIVSQVQFSLSCCCVGFIVLNLASRSVMHTIALGYGRLCFCDIFRANSSTGEKQVPPRAILLLFFSMLNGSCLVEKVQHSTWILSVGIFRARLVICWIVFLGMLPLVSRARMMSGFWLFLSSRSGS